MNYQILEGKLFLGYDILLKSKIPEGTLKSARLSHSESWKWISDSTDRRRVLVDYERLKEKYKNQIKTEFCDGNEVTNFFKSHYLLSLMSVNNSDALHILQFKDKNGKYLPLNVREEYLDASKILSFLSEINRAKIINEYGFKDVPTFYKTILSIIKQNKIKRLPQSYSRLIKVVSSFKKNGIKSIISKRFGSSGHNCKVISDVQIAFITQLYAKGNSQFSAARVALEYNSIAINSGWKPVCTRTIINILNNPIIRQQVSGPRHGIDEFRNFADTVVHRSRPSRPNMLWVGDGTPFELYYQEERLNEKGHRVVNHWARKYVYVVIDAFNDSVMGYSIGESETNELARLAWRNACVNNGVLPDQVKTDNFGIKEMRPFYQAIAKDEAHFTPSAVGNARDKVIEQFFYKLRNQLVREYPSHAGGNITSKEKVNRDFLEKTKKNFPNKYQVIDQIQEIFHRWNTMARPQLNGKSKIEQWNESDHSKDRKLSDHIRLKIFGTQHEYTNRLTNKGIVATLNGCVRKYMLLSNEFADTIGTDYTIIYDSNDLSKILCVAREGRLEFIVPEVEPIPMAYGDMKPGDRSKLNSILQAKKNRIDINIERNRRQVELLRSEGYLKVVRGKNDIMIAESHLKQLLEPDIYDSEGSVVVPIQNNTDRKGRDIFDED